MENKFVEMMSGKDHDQRNVQKEILATAKISSNDNMFNTMLVFSSIAHYLGAYKENLKKTFEYELAPVSSAFFYNF